MTAAGQEIRGRRQRQRKRRGGVRKPEFLRWRRRRKRSFLAHAFITFTSICQLLLDTEMQISLLLRYSLLFFFFIISTIWTPGRMEGGAQRFFKSAWLLVDLSSEFSSLPFRLFIPPPPTPRWRLSFFSSLPYFQSLTSLSQAPLRFHLKTKIYVNLWAGR